MGDSGSGNDMNRSPSDRSLSIVQTPANDAGPWHATPDRGGATSETTDPVAPGEVLALDRTIREAFILLDALDRRTLARVTPPLSPAQYHALTALASVPTQSLNDLAARLLCDKGNASGLIDRLVEAGLVHRSRDHRDKRRLTLTLTPAGRAALDVAAQARSLVLHRALTGLARHSIKQTQQLVAVVAAALQEEIEQAQRPENRGDRPQSL